MKILLGTDGSEASRAGELFLQRWPHAREAEVIVACAYSGPIYFTEMIPGIPAPVDMLQEAYESGKSAALRSAEAACVRLGAVGITAKPRAVEGSAAEALLDLAHEEGVNLIVAGSRGESAVEALFLGSVARRLVAYSNVSVAIARPTDSTKLSVTIAADGSKGAEAAISLLAAQGAAAFSEVVAVCVEPLSMLPPGVDPKLYEDVYKQDHAKAEEIARAATERLAPCADKVSFVTPLGRPAHEIVDAAKRHNSDLIAVGATRHGAIERFLLGSVAGEIAADAHCSVLVVRP